LPPPGPCPQPAGIWRAGGAFTPSPAMTRTPLLGAAAAKLRAASLPGGSGPHFPSHRSRRLFSPDPHGSMNKTREILSGPRKKLPINPGKSLAHPPMLESAPARPTITGSVAWSNFFSPRSQAPAWGRSWKPGSAWPQQLQVSGLHLGGKAELCVHGVAKRELGNQKRRDISQFAPGFPGHFPVIGPRWRGQRCRPSQFLPDRPCPK
jgi:hypothetical protein